MAVLNKRAIVTAIEMYGVTAIRLGRTLNPALDVLIKALFANNEQGFAYDPNDLTTLYQDAAGTIPVTAVGQPVGLMRDKSRRNNHAFQTVSASRPILRQTPILGDEVILNGSFGVGTTNWIPVWATLSQQLGELKVTNVGGKADEQAQQRIETRLIPQRLYQLTVSAYKDITATSYSILVETGSATLAGKLLQTNTGKATHTLLFTAPTLGSIVTVRLRTLGLNGSAYFDDVSVKEITGYYADQKYLDFDGVDDRITTTLPAQLTGCTVIRSVPNVGTQILTNQTIPTPYNDNIDNCGLIVINRDLTASETSQITTLFNKAAGV